MKTNKQPYQLFDMNDEFEFYAYIVESRLNGQHSQAKELFFMLSQGMQGQRAYFLNEYLPEVQINFEKSWPIYLGIEKEEID